MADLNGYNPGLAQPNLGLAGSRLTWLVTTQVYTNQTKVAMPQTED